MLLDNFETPRKNCLNLCSVLRLYDVRKFKVIKNQNDAKIKIISVL